MVVPSSAQQIAPINEKRPEAHQESNAIAGEPEYCKTDVGVKNIPEPIIFPTIKVTPLASVIFFFNALNKSQ